MELVEEAPGQQGSERLAVDREEHPPGLPRHATTSTRADQLTHHRPPPGTTSWPPTLL
jgi:hypothetical protein